MFYLIVYIILNDFSAYRTIVASYKTCENARIHELHCKCVLFFYLIKTLNISISLSITLVTSPLYLHWSVYYIMLLLLRYNIL